MKKKSSKKSSVENGISAYYQNGLDFKPRSIAQNGETVAEKRKRELMEAADKVSKTQPNSENLKTLLLTTAWMENSLGANPKAYGRDYTRGPMSIDDIAYDDLMKPRGENNKYTSSQKKTQDWMSGTLGINYPKLDSLLRVGDPLANMATARAVYGRSPDPVPSKDDPQAIYDYYMKNYNKGGASKYEKDDEGFKRFKEGYDLINPPKKKKQGGVISKAQDGETITKEELLNHPLNKGNEMVAEEKQFLKDWINSERFKTKFPQNLKEIESQKADSKYEGWLDTLFGNTPEEDAGIYTKKALERLDNVRVFGNPNYRDSNKLSGLHGKAYGESEYDRLSRELLSSGSYSPYYHKIWLNNNTTDTKTHELTHATSLDDIMMNLAPVSENFSNLRDTYKKEYGNKENVELGWSWGQPVLKNMSNNILSKDETILSGEKLKQDAKQKGYDLDRLAYLNQSSEVYARIMAIRKKAKLKPEDDIDEEKMKEVFDKTKDDSIYEAYNKEQVREMLNKMANASPNKERNKDVAKNGRVIEDNMGQWAHPGEITKINSNKITMKGVDYPVLGVSDTGEQQLMFPDKEYKFGGSSVTEYPIMENGGNTMSKTALKRLDDLVNFTNYQQAQAGAQVPQLTFREQVLKAMASTAPGQIEKRPDLLEKIVGKPTKNSKSKAAAKSAIRMNPASLKNGGKAQWGEKTAPKINDLVTGTGFGTGEEYSYAPSTQPEIKTGNPAKVSPFGIQDAINMGTAVAGGVGMIKQQKQQVQQSEQFKQLSGIVKQATDTRPEQVKRKYVRPEDMISNPEEMSPSYGTGTTFLESGGKIPYGMFGANLGADQVGSAGSALGSLIGGGKGQVGAWGTIGSQIGKMIPIPGVSQIASGVLGLAGGIFDGTQMKKMRENNEEAQQNMQQAAMAQGVNNIQQQYSSYVKHGGSIPQMGGQLQSHWGGGAETVSVNPHLPDGGESVLFKGQSHDDGGIGITFGGSPVEVEGGEPAVKLQDGGTGGNNLVVFGNMRIPEFGVSEIGDPKAKGKKFKSYVNDLNKQEAKQNKTVDRTMNFLEGVNDSTPFNRLKLGSAEANIIGTDMKLKEIAQRKQTASSIQNAILETAEEMGLQSDALAKGKIKKAKNGAKIPKAQDSIQVKEEFIPRSKQDEYMAYGYRPDPEDPNRLYRDLTNNSTVTKMAEFKSPVGGTRTKDEEKYWTDVLIPMLEKGITPEQLLTKDPKTGKRYMHEAHLERAKQYYKPISEKVSRTDRDYIYLKDDEINSQIGKLENSTSQEATPEEEGAPPKSNDFADIFNAMMPMFRPSNQQNLDPNQLMGEMFAMSANQLEPVQAQLYQPLLEQTTDISYQDQMNANQADFNAMLRTVGNNPAAQAALAAQKYAANSGVLGEQFRQNQTQKLGVYNRNRGVLNDATLKNLGILDQQFVRQSTAKSATKAQTQSILNSISDKIARNKLENRTLGIYENLYNYRFGPRGYAYNLNPLAQINIPQGAGTDINAIPNMDKIKEVTESIVTEDATGKKKKQEKTSTTKTVKNGSIVKAIKNL